MKLCPSPTCLNPDGSSTLCPVQNKVCYTCGHVFLKNGAAGGSAPQATHGSLKPHTYPSSTPVDSRGKPRSRPHRGAGFKLHPVPGYRQPLPPPRGMGGQMPGGGMIPHTNGMKFVTPPPLSPTVPSITPAAAAGGFVYVQSPVMTGAGAGMGHMGGGPGGFNLAGVQPYYPAGGQGGGYYGAQGGGYDGGYGGYGGYHGGKRGGRYPRGGNGQQGGMGMGGAYAGGMGQFYGEPAMAYGGGAIPAQQPYYGGAQPYYAGPAMGPGGRY